MSLTHSQKLLSANIMYKAYVMHKADKTLFELDDKQAFELLLTINQLLDDVTKAQTL